MEVDIIELQKRFPGLNLDWEKIKWRRETLKSMGYFDFTWYSNMSKSAYKEFMDYKFQGGDWIKYSRTCKNLHLLTDEEFQAELDALPEKEKIAEEALIKFVEDAKAKLALEEDLKKNEGLFQLEDKENLISAITDMENVISSKKSKRYNAPFIKLLEELNRLKNLE